MPMTDRIRPVQQVGAMVLGRHAVLVDETWRSGIIDELVQAPAELGPHELVPDVAGFLQNTGRNSFGVG